MEKENLRGGKAAAKEQHLNGAMPVPVATMMYVAAGSSSGISSTLPDGPTMRTCSAKQ